MPENVSAVTPRTSGAGKVQLNYSREANPPLRKAPLVLSCVAIALVTLGVLQAARSALDRSFAGIEHETARQSIERVRRALEADFRQLALTTADYGNWDDTWSYATGDNPSYVGSELLYGDRKSVV